MNVSLADRDGGMTSDFLERKGIRASLAETCQQRVTEIVQAELLQRGQNFCDVMLRIDGVVGNMILARLVAWEQVAEVRLPRLIVALLNKRMCRR